MSHIESNEPVVDGRYIELARHVNAMRPQLPGEVIPNGWRADSSTSIVATARQLLFVVNETYNQQLPDAMGIEFLPPPKQRAALGHRQFTWHEMESRGSAVINVELENDAPTADLGIEEQPAKRFAYVQEKYKWSIADTWTTDLTGINLQVERGKACKEHIVHKHDDLILIANGDAALWGGLYGLFALPGTLTYTIDTGGTSGATLWAGKTGREIFDDLMNWYNYMVTQTLTLEKPNTTLIPLSAFLHALKQQMGVDNMVNPIKHFLDTLRESGMAKDYEVKPSLKLGGMGSGGTGRAIVYKAGDPTRVMRNDVTEFYQMPPLVVGTDIEVRCFAKSGGCIAPRAKSILRIDGL